MLKDMKKIEAEFKNRFVTNIVFYILLMASVLVCLQLSGELYHNVPSVLINQQFKIAVAILFFSILAVPFIAWGVFTIFLRIKLKLSRVDEELIIVSKGVFSKTIVPVPVDFEGRFVCITSKFSGRKKIYFQLKIKRKVEKSLEYHEVVHNDRISEEMNAKAISIKKPRRMLVSDDKYPGRLLKIYQILEKYSGKADARKESVDSPFETQ